AQMRKSLQPTAMPLRLKGSQMPPMSAELLNYFAGGMRERHPDWTAEQIAGILAHWYSQREEEHLAQCQAASDEQYRRQQASARERVVHTRPEPIATEGPLTAPVKLLPQTAVPSQPEAMPSSAPAPQPESESANEILKEDAI